MISWNLPKVQAFNEIGLAVEDAQYLLGIIDQFEYSKYPAERDLLTFLNELREVVSHERLPYDDINSINKQIEDAADEDKPELERQKLALMLPLIERKLETVFTDNELEPKASLINRAMTIVEYGFDTNDPDSIEANFVNQYFIRFADSTEAIAQFHETEPNEDLVEVPNKNSRIEYVLRAILRQHVAQIFAVKYTIDPWAMRHLLSVTIHNVFHLSDADPIGDTSGEDNDDPAEYISLIDYLVSADFVDADLPSTKLIDKFDIVNRELIKFGLLSSALQITDQMLIYFESEELYSWSPLQFVEMTADGLLKMKEFDALIQRFEPHETWSLYDFFHPISEDWKPVNFDTFDEMIDALVEYTGWQRDSLEFLLGGSTSGERKTGYNFAPGEYAHHRWLVKLAEAFGLIEELRVSAAVDLLAELSCSPASLCWRWSKAYGWDNFNGIVKVTDEIKNHVKSLFTDEQRYELFPPERNKLRLEQRDILQSYHVAGIKHFDEMHDLYEYYLVDYEMAPCFMTSRTKLAISSVQAFIQRLLIGLEEVMDSAENIVKLNRQFIEQWKWRKNYRLWEANRKVFVYPENWILPDLRDDKTPFYKEFEGDLLQNEITDANVEKAYINYLRKLDDTSNLEICGLYKEYHYPDANYQLVAPINQAGDANPPESRYAYLTNHTLHVFGRAKNIAQTYYYRRLERGVWTPWEAIGLDINSNQILPVVYNRRLYLFWPQFTKKTTTKYSSDFKLQDEYVEVQFFWSIYQGDKWSTPIFSKDKVTSTELSGLVRNFIRERINARDEDDHHTGTQDKDEPFELPWDVIEEIKRNQEWINEGGHIRTRQDVQPFRAYDKQKEEDWEKLVKAYEKKGLVYGEDDFYFKLNINEDNELKIGVIYAGWYPGANEKNKGSHSNALLSRLTSNKVIDYLDRAFASYSGMMSSIIVGGFTMDGCTGELKRWGESLIDYCVFTKPVKTFRNGIRFEHTKKSGPMLNLMEKYGNGNFIGHGTYAKSFKNKASYRNGWLKLYGKNREKALREYSILPAYQDPFFMAESPFAVMNKKHTILVTPYDMYKPEADVISLRASSGDENSVSRAQLLATPSSGWSADVGHRVVPEEPFYKPHGDDQLKEVPPWWLNSSKWIGKGYEALAFYHPFSCQFIKQINRYGISGLLDPGFGDPRDDFDKTLQIQGAKPINGKPPLPKRLNLMVRSQNSGLQDLPADIDFGLTTPYGIYNWELFFHMPLKIATELSKNQRFEEAQKWFHYIFDPTITEGEAPERYWKTRPFYEYAVWANDLSTDHSDIYDWIDEKENIEVLLEQWRNNPFNPHLIARFRKQAYMKATARMYLDNLIAWGDMLFRRDTMESLNEASQLYMFAAQLLDRRPRIIEATPSTGEIAIPAYRARPLSFITPIKPEATVFDSFIDAINDLGVPPNDELLEYWDTVEDRLFKIRNCMNIKGQVRQLALYAPPIDPALLVKAAAAGLDIGSVLNDLYTPRPIYRYRVLQQKAVEFCNDVKSLGNTLLSTLEKKDAEELALMRTVHEGSMNEAITRVKQRNIEEAAETLESIRRTRATAQARLDHYEELIKNGVSAKEKENEDELSEAHRYQDSAGAHDSNAAISHILPNISVGVTGVSTSFGGSNVGSYFNSESAANRRDAAKHSHDANLASIQAGYDRREEDWELQQDQAAKELEQIEKQIAAAEIRLAIAQHDLDNHRLQIENTQQVETFLKNKYTNQQLYSWMKGQIAGVYFQAYQLAFEMARQTEKAYFAELVDQDASKGFVKFDNWDSLNNGLLAGEKLHNDLKRLDSAYLENNERRQEITKQVSLAMVSPEGLMKLKGLVNPSDGYSCLFTLPEALFDMDFPSHYLRLIKSVSVTIPCVAGPYASISARLTLDSSDVRKQAGSDDGDLVAVSAGTSTSIATSNGLNDSGMFELNFNDERFLPFEGAGAVNSTWRIEFPTTVPQFDYSTISDVILTILYTAQDGGESKRAIDPTKLGTLGQSISLKQMFPTELNALKEMEIVDANNPSENILFDVTGLLPYFIESGALAIESVGFYQLDSDGTATILTNKISVVSYSYPHVELRLTATDALSGAEDVFMILNFCDTQTTQ